MVSTYYFNAKNLENKMEKQNFRENYGHKVADHNGLSTEEKEICEHEANNKCNGCA